MERGLPADVSGRLRRLRARLGLTQAQLAARLGVSTLSAVRWEHAQALPRRSVWAQVEQLEQEAGSPPPPAGPAPHAAAGPPPAGPDGEAPAPNLPAAISTFVGRERELAEVEHLLGRSRLLTFSGPAGCGKSRLALEAGRRLQAGYTDGVRLVELAALVEPEQVPQAVAAALGVKEQADRPLTESLVAALRSRQILLVLDNCEHLLDACARLVDRCVRACPRLTLLCTSREPLGLAGETVWTVPPLALPEQDADERQPTAIALDRLAAADAVRLFLARAQERQPGFALSAENAGAVARICVRLDGLPLAIEMAAARVPLLTPHEIVDRLDDRFHLLTGSRRVTVPRHQTLRAALDWSFALLSVAEQTLFARLGVFAGGFNLASVEAVAADAGANDRADVLELLGQLVEKSLVVAEARHGRTRYRLLETLRDYARERLADAGETPAACSRHAAHYLALAEGLAKQLWGADQQAGLAGTALEHDNLRAALAWLIDQDDAERALRLAAALAPFWMVRGRYSEGRAWLARSAACNGPCTPGVRGIASARAASLARLQSDYAAAQRLAREALALAEAIEDRRAAARALAELAAAQFEGGERAAAVELGEECLALLRELDDSAGLTAVLTALGLEALLRRHYGLARARMEEAAGHAERAGRRDTLAMITNNLGLIARGSGDHETARARLDTAMRLAAELGEQRVAAYAHANLAMLEAGLGRTAAALDHTRQALAITVELGMTSRIHLMLASHGVALAAARRFERAARCLGKFDAWRAGEGASAVLYYAPEQEQARAEARAALGPERYEALAAAGAALPVEQLVSEALAEEAGSGPDTAPSPVMPPTAPLPIASAAGLTQREREVLALLVEGLSVKEIARRLVLSPRTVERHLANVYPKLGVHGRAEAVALVARYSVI